MAYNTQEERLKVKGSEQITRDLKVNRDTFVNGTETVNSMEPSPTGNYRNYICWTLGDGSVVNEDGIVATPAGTEKSRTQLTVPHFYNYINGQVQFLMQYETTVTCRYFYVSGTYYYYRAGSNTRVTVSSWPETAKYHVYTGETATVDVVITDSGETVLAKNEIYFKRVLSGISVWASHFGVVITNDAVINELNNRPTSSAVYRDYKDIQWNKIRLTTTGYIVKEGSVSIGAPMFSYLNADNANQTAFYTPYQEFVPSVDMSHSYDSVQEVLTVKGNEKVTRDLKVQGYIFQDEGTFARLPIIESGEIKVSGNDVLTTADKTATVTQSSTDVLTSGGAYTALAGKQDTLTFDNVPTQNSDNPVKSGGIYTELAGKIDTTEKGVSNGVATLDATGRVPYQQLPESAMEYKGTWDASTNTPTLADGTGDNGDFYVVSAGGTVNFGTVASPRNVTFYINDRAIYDGATQQWARLPASEVRTVNGMSGDVTLTASDVGAATSTDITNAVNALDASDTAVAGQYVSSVSEANGIITVTRETLPASTTTALQLVANPNNVVQYKATSMNGLTIQDTQANALYIEGREDGTTGDTGGLAITNDAVNVFGAGDTDGVLRVINEDNVAAGPVFKVMKDGQVYATGIMHGTVDNADTVDGYHASELGAAGSTVAVRNSNGYLNATIFHDEWGVENINSYSSPTVMFKGNGDGYLRNTSIADLKKALDINRVDIDWNDLFPSASTPFIPTPSINEPWYAYYQSGIIHVYASLIFKSGFVPFDTSLAGLGSSNFNATGMELKGPIEVFSDGGNKVLGALVIYSNGEIYVGGTEVNQSGGSGFNYQRIEGFRLDVPVSYLSSTVRAQYGI